MARRFWPIFNTILFTIFVPGTVAILIPRWLTSRNRWPENGPLTWIGGVMFVSGAAIYFRCAWEFAVRGLGPPAPIAPTKFLVTTALHRYVRNPMYLGVLAVIMAWATAFRSWAVTEYALAVAVGFHLMVLLVEEPVLRRQFGEAYTEYCRRVARWMPRRPHRD